MLTDFTGNNTYSTIVTVGKCGIDPAAAFTIYPNPSTGIFTLLYKGDKPLVYSTRIMNALGENIYESQGFQPTYDLSNNSAGAYFLQIHLPSKTISLEVVLVK